MCIIVPDKTAVNVGFKLNHDFDNDPGRFGKTGSLGDPVARIFDAP